MAKILGQDAMQEIGRHNLGHLDLGPRSCSRSYSRFFHWEGIKNATEGETIGLTA